MLSGVEVFWLIVILFVQWLKRYVLRIYFGHKNYSITFIIGVFLWELHVSYNKTYFMYMWVWSIYSYIMTTTCTYPEHNIKKVFLAQFYCVIKTEV